MMPRHRTEVAEGQIGGTMQRDIMAPEHPHWDEFVERLDTALLTLEDPDTGESDWVCPHDPMFPLATDILTLMASIDIEATLAYFAEHVSCDCEILLNMLRNPSKR
jgi:hypothetical protein